MAPRVGVVTHLTYTLTHGKGSGCNSTIHYLLLHLAASVQELDNLEVSVAQCHGRLPWHCATLTSTVHRYLPHPSLINY